VRELAQVIRELRNDGVAILLIEQNVPAASKGRHLTYARLRRAYCHIIFRVFRFNAWRRLFSCLSFTITSGFSLMIDAARAEPLLIENTGAASSWSSPWKNMNG
jgi:hypothetical protein